ncbi:MAG: ABC transporter permease subunit [Oscillospiraceae bacterium]|nr:ABC transporter permease subunit [Oscillospiraceae bacterium]
MSGKHVKLSPASWKLKTAGILVAIAAVFMISFYMLDLNLVRFVERLGNAGRVLALFVAFDATVLPDAILEMLTSLAIAVAALAVGFIISIALAFLAAANTAPSKIIASIIKSMVAIIRAVPSLVWILMIVASIGFGNTAGMVALLLSTCGYLVKAFASSIEEKGSDSIEAMRAVGANWFGIVLKGVLPGVIGSFLSWTSIRFESNITESVTLGMVGVGGIGTLLMRAISQFNYGRIVAILAVIVSFMLFVELVATALRRRINK